MFTNDTNRRDTNCVSLNMDTWDPWLLPRHSELLIERLFSILSITTCSRFYFYSARGNPRMVCWVESDEPA